MQEYFIVLKENQLNKDWKRRGRTRFAPTDGLEDVIIGYFVGKTFAQKWRMDSRFRGNDRDCRRQNDNRS